MDSYKVGHFFETQCRNTVSGATKFSGYRAYNVG